MAGRFWHRIVNSGWSPWSCLRLHCECCHSSIAMMFDFGRRMHAELTRVFWQEAVFVEFARGIERWLARSIRLQC